MQLLILNFNDDHEKQNTTTEIKLTLSKSFSLHQWEESTTLSPTYLDKDMLHILLELGWSRMDTTFLLG